MNSDLFFFGVDAIVKYVLEGHDRGVNLEVIAKEAQSPQQVPASVPLSSTFARFECSTVFSCQSLYRKCPIKLHPIVINV